MLGKDSQLKSSTITLLLGIAITFIKLVAVLVYALPIFLDRANGIRLPINSRELRAPWLHS